MAGQKGRSGRRKTPNTNTGPHFAPTLPPKPEGLHPNASSEWDRLAPLCAKRGLLTEGDWTAWCIGFDAMSRMFHAQDKLTSDGEVYEVNGQKKAHPSVTIAKRHADAVMQFCREFGLTPSSRTSLDVQVELPEGQDEMEDLVN